MIQGATQALASPGVVQFVKFCLVGASSTIIDFGIYNVLLRLGFTPALALSVSFLVSVSNGFFWNRRWTFRQQKGNVREQAPKFLATNAVGWFLNLTITTLALVVAAHYHLTQNHFSPAQTLYLVLFRKATGDQGFSLLALNAAKLCATVVVLAWNFSAAKFITFRNR